MIKGHKKQDAAKPRTSLVPIRKWLFSVISVSDSDFDLQNTSYIHMVKIFAFLNIAKNISFLDGPHCFQLGDMNCSVEID